ncbi:unnamed protein product [Pseudo-nitzschia multistriata]|uniref:Uncharacterized protein n=1 Tax=Pseudo-nitzschia multistriata TaxID=183589 RepID=A0A448Z5P3_9STRA|nr:unnamed protein product [Pseudo-nitzschia multistriata]
MAAFSYLGHFTAPDLYHSFRTENENVLDDCHVTTADGDDADVGNGYVNANKNCALDSFFNVSFGGFTLTTIINCLVMTCGFLTFGGNSMGIILNNL